MGKEGVARKRRIRSRGRGNKRTSTGSQHQKLHKTREQRKSTNSTNHSTNGKETITPNRGKGRLKNAGPTQKPSLTRHRVGQDKKEATKKALRQVTFLQRTKGGTQKAKESFKMTVSGDDKINDKEIRNSKPVPPKH